MQLAELFRTEDFVLSIEIFPPKTEAGDDSLRKNLSTLVQYRPAFVSCTYGAGGSTRDRTINWCRCIQEEYGRTATAHFTCVGSSRTELEDWLMRAREAGIHNIMALRGDPPQGQDAFVPAVDGLTYANELVELIRAHDGDFGIGVAGYPEKHPEARDAETDLVNLKRKVDAGADAVFTQLFFVNDNFRRFRERCESAGITVPIVPGIMPITEFSRIRRITGMCGAVFPPDLASQLQAVHDDEDAQFEIGVNYAIAQCRELIADGVPGLHLYALNKSKACEEILDALDFPRAAVC